MSAEADAELAWSRRQLDALATENLRLTDRATRVQRELEVRRRGFSLLAGLGRTLGVHLELKPALSAAIPFIETGLQVQRVVALERDGDAFVPFAWSGYRTKQAENIAGARVRFPERVTAEGILVTGVTPEEPWLSAARETLGVPVFVAAPVAGAEILLLAGRDAEHGFTQLRLVQADVDILLAVGELVAAVVQNAQVAALSEVRRFVPPAVAEELMSGRMAGGLGYDRRDVTLLAADMVGFTNLAEAMDTDRLAELLNRYLQEMTAMAHAHGGTVGSLSGDGLLVIFGAPESTPARDHAWAAVQTAFAMRARAAVIAADGDPVIQIRVGLNTGSCAVGVFGSSTQRQYTAIGLPVNLAARLQVAASPGEVLVSETTLALVAERVSSRPRGKFSLKGFAAPVSASAIDTD